MTARIVPDGQAGRLAAIEVLRWGGIVALPTDTVYGICVALDSADGVERLFRAKQRPEERGIILLLDALGQASEIGVMTPAAIALADACWPGGLSVVVTQRADLVVPLALTAGSPTVGLRVPNHDAPRALARAVGPLPTTSANVSGLPAAPSAAAILDQLGDSVDLILDGGPAHGGAPSTVVDCTLTRVRILREGAVTARRVFEILDAAGLSHQP